MSLCSLCPLALQVTYWAHCSYSCIPTWWLMQDEEEDSKPEAPPTPKASAVTKETKLRSKDDNFKAQDEQR